MGSDPRFGSGVGFEAFRPLFYWGSPQTETKRVFSGLSLGNPRASPPRIRSRTGRTRSISMGCEPWHLRRRRFSWKAGYRLRCFKPPMSRTKTGRDVVPTHSPHHAFQVARICCRCREEKCCKPLDSLMIQSIRDLGQRHLPPPPRSSTIHPQLATDLLPGTAGRSPPDQSTFVLVDPQHPVKGLLQPRDGSGRRADTHGLGLFL